MAASFPTSIKSFSANQDDVTDVNAAYMDQRDDEIEAIETALLTWTTWTPTITQSGSVTCTVTYSKYLKLGKVVITQGVLTVTGSGTTANAIIIGGIPAGIQPAMSDIIVGTGMVVDTGSANHISAVQLISSSTFRFISAAQNVPVGTLTAAFALANTDVIRWETMWEIT